MNAVRVVAAGPLSTVQDLGRPGHAHLGVPPGGALDPGSLRLANRLVGNPEDAAGLETTLGGLRVAFDEPTVVALAGAPAPFTVARRPAPLYAPVHVPAGVPVALRSPVAGVRSYLAVAGGITVPPVLGSRSTDVLSGLGPAVLARGDVLPVGAPIAAPGAVDSAPGWPPGWPPGRPSGDDTVRLHPGPRADWFTDAALRTLLTRPYQVSPDSNRIAARLDGPELTRARGGELPSEGLVTGAVQVPAGGRPLIFLADHPTTGGYPVIGVVDPDDLAVVAQARPGSTIRFRRGAGARHR